MTTAANKTTECANCGGPVSAAALDLCQRFDWPEPECLRCQRENISHACLAEDERDHGYEAALTAAERGASASEAETKHAALKAEAVSLLERLMATVKASPEGRTTWAHVGDMAHMVDQLSDCLED